MVDVVIVGLGYVGLPLAQEAAHAGLSVLGFDISDRVVDGLNAGRSHVDDIDEAGLSAMIERGFAATSDESSTRGAGAYVICVPTPLAEGGGPDLGAVTGAAEFVGRNLTEGALVILESTVYPGTTEDEVLPILERVSGLKGGTHFDLAFSPERVNPGDPVYGTKNTPKVVGGLTPAATDRAAEFYGRFVDTVVKATGAREAETAKLLENTYRHVNIALVNEMARFCHELGIDVWDVIRLARTKPFGFQAFYPGPGVGGHCIPIDPNYLSYHVRSKLGYPFRFVELAQEINATMPTYTARRVQDLLNAEGKPLNGSVVLILGVTYKADIADQRESPAVPFAEALRAGGATVQYHDPKVPVWRLGADELTCVDDLDAANAAADVTVLVQAHTAYDADILAKGAQVFFDTRGVTTDSGVHKL